ncbi:MAG: DUF371 domain-containing protein [Halodesulfurarchaeum sp.]
MALEERVTATGHENVLAEHSSTFEVTTEDFLTRAGDCILAIGADRAPADFDAAFVEAAQDRTTTIAAIFEAGDSTVEIRGRGDPQLTFENEVSLVGRTSDYVDDRTIMVEANAAAADLDREFVTALGQGAELSLTLRVE